MDKEKIAIDIAKKVASQSIKPYKKSVTNKLQNRAISSLEELSIDEDMARKGAAAIAIGKAVMEKKFKMKLNNNTSVDVDLTPDKEKIGFFYNKSF